ncbi:helix-turn-helix transcriptional regulator [Maribacter arcticus]|uniref:Predicted DNA-binding transcriptional regulator YafY, contains an HTH and WYL domains n=1 Tax=Maribacter arcticus TaxID=561365 RepID=A0A1T5AJJ3_9FLAO|nr:WYL domain-containing protein [Maribacter arcticus]SKB34937.1 Predicted DNA-binding transcriptional regulator YafY, contains an HTH and WYL domains [Maribacter arcticus]
MPINKNALIRYQALDRCFSNPGRRYDINALLEICNEALFEYNPGATGIKKRQLYEDIRFMESSQGYSIELEKLKEGRRTFYKYLDSSFSITKNPINELEAEQLKSAMMVLTRFKGMPQFEWVNELLPKLDQTFLLKDRENHIMAFENNPFLKGLEFLNPIFNAISHKKCIEISYQPFGKQEFTTNFFPYHLKQFNSRWFLFGQNPNYESLTNYPLDRINMVNEIDIPFSETEIDFEEYFEDVIGVTLNEGQPEIIELKVNSKLWPYIETKPLHGSQKIKQRDENFVFITLHVIPNFELEKLILSFGEDIIVYSPTHFQDTIKCRLQKNLNAYD